MSDSTDLPEVSPETLARFEANRMTIVNAVVARFMQRPDAARPHATQSLALLTTRFDFWTRSLGIAMEIHDSEMVLLQLDWANDRLPHDGVEPQHILERFRILAEVVRATLTPADAAVVNRYIDALITREEEYLRSAARRR